METKAKAKTYEYRVLIPILPTAEQHAAGEGEVVYRVVGQFLAPTPTRAVEKAGEEGAIPLEWMGPVIAVVESAWHHRDVTAKQTTIWEVTAPGPVSEPPSAPEND